MGHCRKCNFMFSTSLLDNFVIDFGTVVHVKDLEVSEDVKNLFVQEFPYPFCVCRMERLDDDKFGQVINSNEQIPKSVDRRGKEILEIRAYNLPW